MPLEDRLKTVFAATLELPPTVDVAALGYRDVSEWDSISHLLLVSAIEKAFDIMLDTDDVIGMSSFAKAVEIVGKYVQPVEA